MNSEIVSAKLLLYSFAISVIILCLLTFLSLNNANVLLVCNSEDRLTAVMRIEGNNILINPSNDNQTIECLGKILAFYDKSIDVIITDDINSLILINKYFKVKKTVLKNEVKIATSKITVENNYLSINVSQKKFYIFQRPVKQLQKAQNFSHKNSRIIRPISDGQVEVFMKKISYDQSIINDSSIIKYSL